jgi:serine phosphatase RsbU (regulator of sigma subunit)
MRLYLFAIATLLFAFTIVGVEPNDRKLTIQNGFVSADATLQMDYLFSTEDHFTSVAASRGWAPVRAPVLQERAPGDRVWLRLRLRNQSGKFLRLVLAGGEARTDKVRFFLTEFGKVTLDSHAGDIVNLGTRPAYLAAHFSFDLAAGSEAAVFLWVENPVDIAADFTLMRADAFAEWGGFNYLLQGIFFGALTALFFYYGAIYFSLRSQAVGAYLWYLLATGIFFAARTGFLYQAFAFPYGRLMNILITPLPAVIYATGIRFMRVFLDLDRSSFSDRLLRCIQFCSLLPVPVAFFSRAYSREICDWLTLILGPGLLVFAWAIRAQAPKARLFLLAWCWPIFASLLQYTGNDSSYLMRNVMLQASILIEFVFFAVFVGGDINRLNHERNTQRIKLLVLQEDLEEARRVHEQLLPGTAPKMPGLEIRQVYRPMSELGGDYYDWFKLSDSKIVILVADVTGHGLPAALDAAVVHIAFQTAVVEADTSDQILTAMNQRMLAQSIDRCVSAVCAVYDTALQTIEVSLAGHPQAIVTSAGKAICLGDFAPLLGFSNESTYTAAYLKLQEGDRLFLCTDGAYENPDSESVDDHAEFAELLATKTDFPLEIALIDTIKYFDRLRQNRSFDDVTLLGAQVLLRVP